MIKRQKPKEYYIDNRTSTAKKGKKKKSNTQTPVSHSISYNHHKYQKDEQEYLEEKESNPRKIALSSKQMKMMMRCFQEYCSQNEQSCEEVAQKYKLTAKMFEYLQNNFQLVSSDSRVRSHFIKHITPAPRMKCLQCEELGHDCSQYQFNTIKKKIETDLQELQMKLEELQKKKQVLKSIAEYKQEYESAQAQFNELKRIQQLQLHLLKELKAGLTYY